MKKCIKCNSLIDDNVLSCPICGFDFSLCKKCPKCGKEYLGFSYFCSFCGNPLYNNTVQPQKPPLDEHSEKSVIAEESSVNSLSASTNNSKEVNSEQHTLNYEGSLPLVSVHDSDDSNHKSPEVLNNNKESLDDFSTNESDTDNDIIILMDEEVTDTNKTDYPPNESDKKQYSRRHVSFPVGKQVKTNNIKKRA